jgi:hypothetical protein
VLLFLLSCFSPFPAFPAPAFSFIFPPQSNQVFSFFPHVLWLYFDDVYCFPLPAFFQPLSTNDCSTLSDIMLYVLDLLYHQEFIKALFKNHLCAVTSLCA